MSSLLSWYGWFCTHSPYVGDIRKNQGDSPAIPDLHDSEFGAILNAGHINVRHLLLADSLFRSLSGSTHSSANRFNYLSFSFTKNLELTTKNYRGFAMAALTLTEKLDQLGTRYDELTQELSSAEIVSDSARFQKVAKQQSELGEIVAKHREFKQIEKDLAGAHQMFLEAEDAEMKQMAHDEEKQLTARKEVAERELKLLLLPKDPLDEKSVIVEIRAGTGGDEAALFAAELFRMYSRYAETQGWKVEILESSPSSIGGLKEVVAAIQGQKVYSKLKYESGVHRVQRVPATETQGRIHTSAATVAVLPEADEIDIKIEAKDLRIDTFCSSGPGGQSVNTTYSAGTGRAERIDAQVFRFDLDVDFVGFGENRDSCSGSVNAALRFRGGKALDAVHAAFVLPFGIDLLPLNRGDHLL